MSDVELKISYSTWQKTKHFLKGKKFYLFLFIPLFLLSLFSIYLQFNILRTRGRAEGRILNVSNYGTLQAAITAAVSGDSIYIPAGTWTGSAKVTGKQNITIYGDGSSSILTSPGQVEVLGINSSSNITLRDFAIKGDYNVIDQRGVGIFGLTTGSFSRLTIYDVGFAGIFSRGVLTDALFKDITVRHAGDFGIQVQEGADRITVDGGSFTDMESRQYPAHGVYVGPNAKNVVVRNTYSDNIYDSPADPVNSEISGIKITETTGALVENNINEDSVAGVSVPYGHDVIVRGNTWRRSIKRGAYILAGSTNVTFENNRIETAPIGFKFDEYPSWPSNITLKDNVIVGVATPVSVGLTTGLIQTNNSWQPGYVAPSPTVVPAPPTAVPTNSPTVVPTKIPTAVPTAFPTKIPTAVPTLAAGYGITVKSYIPAKNLYFACNVIGSTSYYSGTTTYYRTSSSPIRVTVTAPATCQGRRFYKWTNGLSSRSISVSDASYGNGNAVYVAQYK